MTDLQTDPKPAGPGRTALDRPDDVAALQGPIEEAARG